MWAIASLAMVILPSGDESACPASTILFDACEDGEVASDGRRALRIEIVDAGGLEPLLQRFQIVAAEECALRLRDRQQPQEVHVPACRVADLEVGPEGIGLRDEQVLAA